MKNTIEAGVFCWNELATTNLEAAKKFYSNVFGWKFTQKDMGDTSYTLIKLNDKEFGGIWSIPKDREREISPRWISYILVENLDESLEKARQNGALIVKPATQAGDFGRFGIIADPAGAHIALWESLCEDKK